MEESASFPAGDVADAYLMSDLERLMLKVDRTIGPYIVYKHLERKLKFEPHGDLDPIKAIASLDILQKRERRLWDRLTHLQGTSLSQGYTKADKLLMLLEDHFDSPNSADPSEIDDHEKALEDAHMDLACWQDDHDEVAKHLIKDVVAYCSALELSITALHMARQLTERFPRHGPLVQLRWREPLGPYAQRRKRYKVEHVCFGNFEKASLASRE